jgi:ribonuclease E
VLRALEEQLIRGATHNLIVRTRPDVALYVLNQKRAHLRSLEERFVITITISADETVLAPQAFIVDRGEQVHTVEAAKALAERAQATAAAAPLEEEDDLEDYAAVEDEEVEAEAAEPAQAALAATHEQDEVGPRRRRRRRRRGGRNGDGGAPGQPHEHGAQEPIGHETGAINDSADEFAAEAEHETPAGDERAEEPRTEFTPQEQGERGEPQHDSERRRRRGRRGGRRNRNRNGDGGHVEGGHGDGGLGERGPREQQTFTPAEELIAPSAAEPGLKDAVADLDTPPPTVRAPVSAEPMPYSPPPAEPEPVRRRSTVRERAPVGGGGEASAQAPTQPAAPASASEPVVIETNEAAEGDRPRKTGWWSRRFAGD